MARLMKFMLRLARNPEAGFPLGDAARGYRLVAPVDDAGKLDVDLWRAARERCTVDRFSPDANERADGWLRHHGDHWYFHYDEEREGPDEPVYRLGGHALRLGEYLTVKERDGDELVYRVVSAERATPE